jgi:acyl carrier protein
MTKEDIEWLIIDLLAKENGQAASDLREELTSNGEHLPIDSLLAAEVLARVEAYCGVELPATAETAKALRSVKAFAQAVWDLLGDEQAKAVSA